MIKFVLQGQQMILRYKASDDVTSNWIPSKMDKEGCVCLLNTFTFHKNKLITEFTDENDNPEVDFIFSTKNKNGYFLVDKKVLGIEKDVFIHERVVLDKKFFLCARNRPIFPKVNSMIEEKEIYLGGDNMNAIKESDFRDLISSFPNDYELGKYVDARIGSSLSTFFDVKEPYEEKYQKYLNKKSSLKNDIATDFVELDIHKYTYILHKLQSMLINEDRYSENDWQSQIVHILLLLFPKYLYICREAPVIDIYSESKRDKSVDYILIDSFGNNDFIEIKKPFNKSIVTKGLYRDNHVPLRELSGSIMQIEKYIFLLNKSGIKGEKKLTEYCKNKGAIPQDFNVKVTNPSGIIIMGRTKELTNDQLHDFEVIKRKFKNIIDIMTYDDLIERLERTVNHLRNKNTE